MLVSNVCPREISSENKDRSVDPTVEIVEAGMARVKNALPRVEIAGTKLPRAKFEVGKISKQRQCPECGKSVRKGNLARHVRARHSAVEVGGAGDVVPDAGVEAIPVSLKVQLPSVRKALRRARSLPSTPESEEERTSQLAKLYSGRVSKPRRDRIGYEMTRKLIALASDTELREELKEVFSQADLLLYTAYEVADLVREAEERGRRERVDEEAAPDTASPSREPPEESPVSSSPLQTSEDDVTLPETLAEADLPEAGQDTSVSPSETCDSSDSSSVSSHPVIEESNLPRDIPSQVPPLYISTCFHGNEQSITIHTGGDFGITVKPCVVRG